MEFLKNLHSLIIILVLLCYDESTNSNSSLDGTWGTIGYGHQLIIDNETTTVYDTSGTDYPPKLRFSFFLLENLYEVTNQTENSLKINPAETF